MPRTVMRQYRQSNGNGLGLYLVQTLNSQPVPCPRSVIESGDTDEENKLLDKIFNYLLAQILSLFELFEYCLIR